MILVILFAVVLVVTFTAVLVFTRPSGTEKALEARLKELSSSSGAVVDDTPDLMKRVTFSTVPGVDAVLRRIALAHYLYDLTLQADVPWTVGRLMFGSIVIFVLAAMFAAAMLRNIAVAVVVGIVAAGLPYFALRVKRAKRFHTFAQKLPEAIDLMSRALRAGHAVTAAIEMVGREIPDPVGKEFRRTFEEQNFGLPLREALINLAARVPVPDLRFMVTAMLVQKETGGNLAEVLDKTAIVIRERARLLGQLRIYTAQGRLTGWILALLPFIIFLLLSLVNPGFTRVLLDTDTGQKLIWIGLGLMALGAYVIRKIVDIKV